MPNDDNKARVRLLVEEVWNRGNLALIPELVAPDYKDHTASRGWPRGPIGHRQAVERNRLAFPDLCYTIEDMGAEGDMVFTRWTMQGTHWGTIRHRQYGLIPARGRQVQVGGMSLRRFAQGKIVELWGQTDTMSLMEQLGVITPPQPGLGTTLLRLARAASRGMPRP